MKYSWTCRPCGLTNAPVMIYSYRGYPRTLLNAFKLLTFTVFIVCRKCAYSGIVNVNNLSNDCGVCVYLFWPLKSGKNETRTFSM